MCDNKIIIGLINLLSNKTIFYKFTISNSTLALYSENFFKIKKTNIKMINNGLSEQRKNRK